MDKEEVFSRVDRLLDDSYPHLEQALCQQVAIPSVEGEPRSGQPFGVEVARALRLALEQAQQLGFDVTDVDGYCGLADWRGQSEEQIGVLGHLDVVPTVGQKWTSDPFVPEKRGGKLYGRGTTDDKGPLLAALYGAWALRQTVGKLNKSVRFIFGCNEETGCRCVEYYKSKYSTPCCGFTPDAEFPIVVGEKGVLQFRFIARWTTCGSPLAGISVGAAANVVPESAQAVLRGIAAAALPQSEKISIEAQADGTLLVKASGVGAHASTPDEGDNALIRLLRYLAALPLGNSPEADFVRASALLFDDEHRGRTMGVADEDELSRSTLIPSMLELNNTGASLCCDLRFPVSRRSGKYTALLEQVAERNGWRLDAFHIAEPLYVDPHSEPAQSLLAVYREVSGDMTEPLVIGGGTYAKEMPNFLAMGPELIDQPMLCHQADEYIDCEHLLRCAKIYARAIYELAK